VVALRRDACGFEIDGLIKAGYKTGGDRRWPLFSSGDRLSPHTVLKFGAVLARNRESIGKLRLAMGFDSKWYVFPKQPHDVSSVRLG